MKKTKEIKYKMYKKMIRKMPTSWLNALDKWPSLNKNQYAKK